METGAALAWGMAVRRGANGVSSAEWDESLEALVAERRWDTALLTLTRAVEAARDGERFGQLLKWFEAFPEQVRTTQEGVRLHLRVLGNLAHPERLEQEARRYVDKKVAWSCVEVFMGWVLVNREADREGLGWIEQALIHEERLSSFEQLLAWRARARAQRRLGIPEWRITFERAVELGTGRTQGITLMEFGSSLVLAGEHAAGMEAFGRARLAFKGDELEPWPLGSQGMAHLHCAEVDEAERCFQEMLAVSGRGRFQSRAVGGMAAVMRVRGEWNRALALYRQAAQLAQAARDEDDLRQARRGQGHTERLRGQPLKALEGLAQAAVTVESDRLSAESWVNVDLAAAHVSLPRPNTARVEELLGQTGSLGAEDADRAVVVRAELARRQGDLLRARALVEDVDRRMVWVREEAMAFPELFALLPAHLHPVPLQRPQCMKVEVRAIGFPEVRLNGRVLHLPTLALVALVGLLDAEGSADSETLAARVKDGKVRDRRREQQRVSKAVALLRTALGWPTSVTSRYGNYVLDTGTEWIYDVRSQVEAGGQIEAFMKGILEFPWVLEREQELLLGDSDFMGRPSTPAVR